VQQRRDEILSSYLEASFVTYPYGIDADIAACDAEVFVIESPSASDHFAGTLEGRGLCELFRLSRVPYAYRSVVDQSHLEWALRIVMSGSARYVHFSCHGDEKGIFLTDGTHLSWREFHDLVWNECDKALKGKVVTFSACLVGCGVEQLLEWHSTFCSNIIAPSRKIEWAEGLAAFSGFYLRARRGTSLGDDVAVMNEIVGPGTFECISGAHPRATRL
jgi:hypothetical protein